MDEQLKVFIKRGQLMIAVLIAALVIFLLGQLGFQSRQLDQQNQNQITVTGTGKVYAKPDVALISLGVTTTATTVADVTKSNTTKMNAVIATVKALKIDEKDIQTTNYSLTPVYENYTIPAPVPLMYPVSGSASGSSAIIRTGSTVTGYKLEQDVQVKIRDFTKIGDVLSQATTSGANVVGDLQFTIDNPEQFKDQARAEAIAEAKTNAKNIAKESGVKLGKIINVYENNYYAPTMYSSAKAMGAGVTDSAPAPVIQPGQQEIDVTINLTYQVR